MRKQYVMFLAIAVLILTACNNSTTEVIEQTSTSQNITETSMEEASSKQETSSQESVTTESGQPETLSDDELTLMQKVLLNKEAFINTASGQEEYVGNLEGYYLDNDKYTNFLPLDINEDGTKEVLVWLDSPDINRNDRTIVFAEIDDTIYCYSLGTDIDSIYSNGLIEDYSGIYRYDYNEKGLTRTPLALREFSERFPAEGEYQSVWIYYSLVDGKKEITKSEFEELVHLDEAEQLSLFELDMTRENIENYVVDDKTVKNRALSGTTENTKDVFNTYQKILLNRQEFIDAATGKRIKVSDLPGYYNSDKYPYGGSQSFYYLDMDNDDKKELIVGLKDGKGVKGTGQYAVFHEIENEVYCYLINYNTLYPMYENGVFIEDLNMFHYTFTENEAVLNYIVSTKDGYYYEGAVGNKEIIATEFIRHFKEHPQTIATEYDLTRENIDKIAV